MNRTIRTIAATLICTSLIGCALTPPPAGQEHVREFTQTSSVPYREAYQIIAKQMRACYRNTNVFGGGYEIQTDLDTYEKTGRVELYHVGLMGASKPEDSIQSRTVIIRSTGTGSTITISGTKPLYVHSNHALIKSWLAGSDSCLP